MPYKIERNKFNALAQIMPFWNIARIFQTTGYSASLPGYLPDCHAKIQAVF